MNQSRLHFERRHNLPLRVPGTTDQPGEHGRPNTPPAAACSGQRVHSSVKAGHLSQILLLLHFNGNSILVEAHQRKLLGRWRDGSTPPLGARPIERRRGAEQEPGASPCLPPATKHSAPPGAVPPTMERRDELLAAAREFGKGGGPEGRQAAANRLQQIVLGLPVSEITRCVRQSLPDPAVRGRRLAECCAAHNPHFVAEEPCGVVNAAV